MDNSTCELIDNIINEWATETFDLTIVIRYRDNAYLLSPNTIQIYFDDYVIIAGYGMFECYDRISMRQRYMPDDINIQSIERNIRELFDNFMDSRLYVGDFTQGEIFAMLKK